MDEKNELIYDRAKHHFLGQFPSILPIEQAYVHIGMFLGWMLEQGLYSKIFEEEEAHQVIRFKNREITCSILSALWDGYLGEDLFNDEGNAFSVHYYQSGTYRKDYQEALATHLPSMYHVEDNWENYDIISTVISKRFEDWEKGTEKKDAKEKNENADSPATNLDEVIEKTEDEEEDTSSLD